MLNGNSSKESVTKNSSRSSSGEFRDSEQLSDGSDGGILIFLKLCLGLIHTVIAGREYVRDLGSVMNLSGFGVSFAGSVGTEEGSGVNGRLLGFFTLLNTLKKSGKDLGR